MIKPVGPWFSVVAFASGTTYFSAVIPVGYVSKLGWGSVCPGFCFVPGKALEGSLPDRVGAGKANARHNLQAELHDDARVPQKPGIKAGV